MNDRFTEALKTALDFIKTRDRFESQTRKHLGLKGFEDQVEPVMAHLHGRRMVDDERVTSLYVHSRMDGAGVGPENVRAELEFKEVDPMSIEAELAKRNVEGIALELAHLRLAKGHSMDKIARFLQSKGYSEDIIDSTIQKLGGGPFND